MSNYLKTFSRISQDYQKVIVEIKHKHKQMKLYNQFTKGETNNDKN